MHPPESRSGLLRDCWDPNYSMRGSAADNALPWQPPSLMIVRRRLHHYDDNPMAPVTPRQIRPFKSAAAFEAWLRANHARATEVWIKIFKKDSGVASVTAAQ